MEYLKKAKIYFALGMLSVCFIDTNGIWLVIPAAVTVICFWSMHINICRYEKHLEKKRRMEEERRVLGYGETTEETESA